MSVLFNITIYQKNCLAIYVVKRSIDWGFWLKLHLITSIMANLHDLDDIKFLLYKIQLGFISLSIDFMIHFHSFLVLYFSDKITLKLACFPFRYILSVFQIFLLKVHWLYQVDVMASFQRPLKLRESWLTWVMLILTWRCKTQKIYILRK